MTGHPFGWNHLRRHKEAVSLQFSLVSGLTTYQRYHYRQLKGMGLAAVVPVTKGNYLTVSEGNLLTVNSSRFILQTTLFLSSYRQTSVQPLFLFFQLLRRWPLSVN